MVVTVERPTQDRVVEAGSTVRIRLEGGEEEEVWTVVPPYDANWVEGKLSTDVPLGAALLGRSAGDTVVVRGPRGSYRARLIDVG